MSRYRYPGVRPFEAGDKNLFFGREQDIRNLRELILLEQLVVLFGRSGYGKSSLLNAGISPQLTEWNAKTGEHYLPVPIRFGAFVPGSSLTPLETLRRRLSENLPENPRMAFLDKLPAAGSLWAFLKHRQPSEKLNLVLLFDQFEEFFTYPEEDRRQWKEQVAELLYVALPQAVRDAAEGCTDEEFSLLVRRLEVKAVFAVRSDRLHFLDQLKDVLPAILYKRYELKALTIAQALPAIELPAALADEGPPFLAPPFSFAPEALRQITDGLSGGTEAGIEAFQLQILCRYLEGQVIEGRIQGRDPEGRPHIEPADLPELVNIYEAYYRRQLDYLAPEEQLPARLIMEEGLLLEDSERGEARRLSVDGEALVQGFRSNGATLALLRRLEDTFLLRREPNTLGGFNYEISHDTLLAPVLRARTERRIAEEKREAEQRALLAEEAVRKEQQLREKAERAEQTAQSAKKRAQTFSRFLLGLFLLTLVVLLAAIRLSMIAREAGNKAESSNRELYNSSLAQRLVEVDPTLALGLTLRNQSANPGNSSPGLTLRSLLEDSTRGFYRLWIPAHQQSIYDLATMPDGKSWVSAAGDGYLKGWDRQGNLLWSIYTRQELRAVAVSPNGAYVLAAGSKNDLLLFDRSGQKRATFSGHRAMVYDLAFSPDGQTILSGSSDYTARVWSLDGRLLKVLNGHREEVMATAFSPDGSYMLTGSMDGMIILWGKSGREIRRWQGHAGGVLSLAFAPGGRQIASGGRDFTARLWNLDGKLLQTFEGHQESVISVAFSPLGDQVLSAGSDKTARLWNLDGTLLKVFRGHSQALWKAVFLPGKPLEVLTASEDRSVRLWQTDWSSRPQVRQRFPDSISRISFSADSRYLLGLNKANQIYFADRSSRKILTTLRQESPVWSLTLSPDGKLWLLGQQNGEARILDAQGKLRQTLEGQKDLIAAAAFSPDGRKVLTGSRDNTCRIWDLDTGDFVEFVAHENVVIAAAFSPDGSKVLTASHDRSARLWTSEGQLINTLRGHTGPVNCVAFSPDGKYLLTGGNDGVIRLWNARGRFIRQLRGHSGIVTTLCFSPDGRYILSAGLDQTLRHWSMSGEPLGIEKVAGGWVVKMQFLGKTSDLMVATSSGAIWNWPGRPLKLEEKGYVFSQAELLASGLKPDSEIPVAELKKILGRVANYQELLELEGKIAVEVLQGRKSFQQSAKAILQEDTTLIARYLVYRIDSAAGVPDAFERQFSFNRPEELRRAGDFFAYQLPFEQNDVGLFNYRQALRLQEQLLARADGPEERRQAAILCGMLTVSQLYNLIYFEMPATVDKGLRYDSTSTRLRALQPLVYLLAMRADASGEERAQVKALYQTLGQEPFDPEGVLLRFRDAMLADLQNIQKFGLVVLEKQEEVKTVEKWLR